MSTVREFVALTKATVSDYLVGQLEQVAARRTISAFSVIDEIRALESGVHKTGTKPPAPFARGVLKGLWHKHFCDARFTTHNVVNHWELRSPKSQKFEDLFQDIAKELQTDEVTDEFVNLLAHRFVIDGYFQRADQERLTGEWLIFSKHEQRNYYLALATHTSGTAEDEKLYRTIRDNCEVQFPFLFP